MTNRRLFHWLLCIYFVTEGEKYSIHIHLNAALISFRMFANSKLLLVYIKLMFTFYRRTQKTCVYRGLYRWQHFFIHSLYNFPEWLEWLFDSFFLNCWHWWYYLSGFCCVCHLFPPLVSIFGLFPVLVSCHYELICVQVCLCDYV